MYRIGQEITIKEDIEIKTIVSNTVMTIKAGDKGVLDGRGFLHITTGECRGKIVKFTKYDIEIKGYDHENITNMIIKKLDSLFCDLDDALDCEGLTFDVLKEELQDVLENIL